MVFKTLHLARQSFAKTFTHGYAQSIVAATQSSYAAQNSPLSHLQSTVANRYGKASSKNVQGTLGSGQQHGAAPKLVNQDSGLAAYFAAWQKHQGHGGNDWQQFQFVKSIEWKPANPAAEPKAKAVEDVVVEEASDVAPPRRGVNRAYSMSAVDDFRKAVNGDKEAEADALAQVDTAIAGEAARVKDDVLARTPSPSAASEETVTPATSVTSGSLSEADVYAEQLKSLAQDHKYGEIPAVFEAMLAAGIKPTAPAYHSLLTAAIKLPRAKHQIVPKALDVYSDMLRRRVVPDTAIYTTLVELLSARALEVISMNQVLEEKRTRYGGMEEEGKFMFNSNEADYAILAEDDSLGLAIKVFNAATSGKVKAPFSDKTYRLVITACAEGNRIDDMVRIYSHMESRKVVPPAEIFAPMIQAFARSGDLRSAVECYDEYKALAISHDTGNVSINRKDNDVYAALVRAYAVCDRADGGMKFLSKVEESLPTQEQALLLRDIVGLKALVPEWLNSMSLDAATAHANEHLSPEARRIALAAVCIKAADRDRISVATEAFDTLPADMDLSGPAMAMGAMHIRGGNVEGAEAFWKVLEVSSTRPQFIESTAMHAVALIGSGQAEQGLRQARQMFARVRDSQAGSLQAKLDVVEQIDEAVEVIGQFMIKRGIVVSPKASMELMWTMIENGGLVTPVAGHLLAGLGPEGIAQLGWDDMKLLLQVQSGVILNASALDIANSARFAHLLEVSTANGISLDEQTDALVEKVLLKLNQPELTQRWQSFKYPASEPPFSPAPYGSFVQQAAPTAPAPTPVAYDDSFDPYAATTDNKGSVAITDLLEKNYGRSSSHFNDAMVRFKNMRRAGRHPRFYVYAKLIAAAAREDRLKLAHDILELAKQDVPFLPQYRVVKHGWTTILDAMVAACLTTGQRRLAGQYHQDLLDMGAAPTANTFGLYITTLKESTKTFDEATEAVKIFLRAKSEGVEPSSFLYNALIGKLGKARRIDDCLFYFGEMRNLGIRPTSVTYGTIVNALCRVSDEKFAEEIFEEMESMPNYKPRPAPYHSMMQFFLTTKRDRSKVLAYYERMRAKKIEPTTHTYKLLIDTYATLEPVDMSAAEAVLERVRESGVVPEAVHYSSLIHAKGCVQHDMPGARRLFDKVLSNSRVTPHPCLYQALFESMVANHQIEETEPVLRDMSARGVQMTPYIANSLIHGWAIAKEIGKAKAIYDSVPTERREPSTYEAMTRAFMAVEDRGSAMKVVNEGLSRGYPAAVAGKILELVGGGKPT